MMTLYSFALFLHIIGAVGLFIALSLEWISLWYLRRVATVEQARPWLTLSGLPGRVHLVSGAAILLPGIYMMATVWGGVAWIILTLAAMLLMIVLGMALTGRRMATIEAALTTERGPISHALHQRLRDPLLWASIQLRIAIALGIVFLMTVKPGLGGALLTIGAAVVLGLTSALPARNRVQLQAATSDVGSASEARKGN
jgi:hypothetical protein